MASRQGYSARWLWKTTLTARGSLPCVSQRFQSALTKPTSALTPAPIANQPDYDIPADKATSTFTPVPKKVQDGSEDTLPAAFISGAPMELQARTVRSVPTLQISGGVISDVPRSIYKESKPPTQSGDFRGHEWRMDWDILPKGHRWENQLMGWQSSGDFMQGTHVNFKTKEDAIHFAEKQGYEYFVQEPNSRKITPKAYANNFLYSPKQLKHIRTK